MSSKSPAKKQPKASTAQKTPVKKSPSAKSPRKAGKTDKSKRRRKGVRSFTSYIYKVLKQVHPDTGMSRKGMSTVNSFVNDIGSRIANEADGLVRKGQRSTVSARDVQTAAKVILPGELAKHAVSEIQKAVTKYTVSMEAHSKARSDRKQKGIKRQKGDPQQSASSRAGLNFGITKSVRNMFTSKRRSQQACIALASVMEYLCAELLELAGNAARHNKAIRIKPRYIKLAIANDQELASVFGATIAGGGVLPNINPKLVKAKKQ